jgi:hypothetical protein
MLDFDDIQHILLTRAPALGPIPEKRTTIQRHETWHNTHVLNSILELCTSW